MTLNNQRFKSIFKPIRLAGVTLPNRIFLGPVVTGLENKSDYQQLAKFYAERARGGTALLTVGGFAFSRFGAFQFGRACFMHKYQIASHKMITDAIHNEGGFALFSLTHVGAQAKHFFAMNPSTIKETGEFAFRMPTPIIGSTIKKAIHTAQLAKEAKYDGVEVDISKNYLLNSFATKGLNRRRDEWGGSAENRFRFALEIVKGIREKLGPDFIITARISLMDFHIDGKDWDETILFAKQLLEAGVNAFSFCFGTNYMNIPILHGLTPEDAFVPFIEMFRAEIDIPVIFGPNLHTPSVINEVLERNPNACIEITQGLIADPFWVKKVEYDADRLIIGCTCCNQGCTLGSVLKHGKLSCMMNPTLFDNSGELMQHTDKPKNVLVVGAGPAGLAAAVFAARRGHMVTIYEASNEIGGQVRFITKIPGKQRYIYMIDLLKRLCNRFDVNIETNHKVTTQELEEIQLQFNHIIFATGNTPAWVDIQGAPATKVYQYPDIFEENLPLGNRVVVLGKNRVAIDVATYLVHKNTTPIKRDEWMTMWGIGDPRKHRAGVVGVIPKALIPYRQVSLLSNGKNSYSIYIDDDKRSFELQWLRILGIKTYTNVNFDSYDSVNLQISFGKNKEDPYSIPADHIIIGKKPTPNNEIGKYYRDAGLKVDIIGAAADGENQNPQKDILQCLREGIELGARI